MFYNFLWFNHTSGKQFLLRALYHYNKTYCSFLPCLLKGRKKEGGRKEGKGRGAGREWRKERTEGQKEERKEGREGTREATFTIIENFPRDRYHTRSFTHVNSLAIPRTYILLLLFYTWGNWGLESLRKLARTAHLISRIQLSEAFFPPHPTILTWQSPNPTPTCGHSQKMASVEINISVSA